MSITGILRRARDPKGLFTPDNDPASNRWYWWDVPAMSASIKLPEGATALAVVIQQLPDAANENLPRPQPPDAKLNNNHLQYAVTWFAFAAILAVIATLFIRQQMKKSAA